jgi:hypothetical protein
VNTTVRIVVSPYCRLSGFTEKRQDGPPATHKTPIGAICFRERAVKTEGLLKIALRPKS